MPTSRQGIGLSIKLSAPMGSSILAGLAVPLIASPMGWRWSYGVATLCSLLVTAVLPPPSVTGHQRTPADEARRLVKFDGLPRLLMVTLAAGLAAAAVNSLSAFVVETAIYHGVDVPVAGLLLTLGGAASIVTRLLVGWLVDGRDPPLLKSAAAMMGSGAVAAVMFASGGGPGTLALATVIAFGPGWAWAPMIILAIVRRYPLNAGTATGVLLG